MPDYDFTMIAPRSLAYGPLGYIMQGNQYFHERTGGYTLSFEYGPLLGFAMGFFITLAKSPPFILMDCFYGALLGLLLVTGYNLFVLSAYDKPVIVEQKPTVHKIMALYREMELDHLRYTREQQENGPIFLRTRSRMRSKSQ
jgi:hypothetical protein